jgi:hypothetical protein
MERFNDQHKRLTDFQQLVWVHCPQCQKQTIAHAMPAAQTARLSCVHCGFFKEVSTRKTHANGMPYELMVAAHAYFDAALWYSAPFKNDTFWAYNPEHLTYLEDYITAKLREHSDREHFTLLEKLPKFYHEAKNREGLLKLIEKLRAKK